MKRTPVGTKFIAIAYTILQTNNNKNMILWWNKQWFHCKTNAWKFRMNEDNCSAIVFVEEKSAKEWHAYLSKNELFVKTATYNLYLRWCLLNF